MSTFCQNEEVYKKIARLQCLGTAIEYRHLARGYKMYTIIYYTNTCIIYNVYYTNTCILYNVYYTNTCIIYNVYYTNTCILYNVY